jgi:peptidoglycan/xylan/chitin deacetylase (PgdA/CDA1 family)/LysM repeat protein
VSHVWAQRIGARRRFWAVLALAVAALCAGQLLLSPVARAAGCPAPISSVLTSSPATAQRTVALTFDDGPRPDSTPAVLDALRARGVTATFFVTGSNAARYPDLVRRIVAEGHALGNHTWSHPDLSGLSPAGRVAEIERTSQAVLDATGTTPCFFRGPYGIHAGPSIGGLAVERGMSVVGWTLDTRDWTTPAGWSPAFQQQIVAAATAPAGAHPIVLMHDGGGYRQNTVAALDRIISDYAARGYVFTDPAGGNPRQGAGGGDGPGTPAEDGGGSGGTYVVRPGDSLSSIAAGLGVPWQELHAANRDVIGPDPGLVKAGQRLVVPGARADDEGAGAPSSAAGSTTYVVRPGDSLSSIAARFGLSWQDLHAANRDVVPDPRVVRAGQELAVPGR